MATELRSATYPDVYGDGTVTAMNVQTVLNFSADCGAGNYSNDEDSWEKYLNDKANGGAD